MENYSYCFYVIFLSWQSMCIEFLNFSKRLSNCAGMARIIFDRIGHLGCLQAVNHSDIPGDFFKIIWSINKIGTQLNHKKELKILINWLFFYIVEATDFEFEIQCYEKFNSHGCFSLLLSFRKPKKIKVSESLKIWPYHDKLITYVFTKPHYNKDG